MASLPKYEIYAVRYASMPRTRSNNFIGGDPHDGPMPMDFFVWLIRSPERVVLVDTGFNASTARKRQRDMKPVSTSTTRSGERVVLVDTGFNASTARKRQRDMIQCPIEALSKLNVQ